MEWLKKFFTKNLTNLLTKKSEKTTQLTAVDPILHQYMNYPLFSGYCKSYKDCILALVNLKLPFKHLYYYQPSKCLLPSLNNSYIPFYSHKEDDCTQIDGNQLYSIDKKDTDILGGFFINSKNLWKIEFIIKQEGCTDIVFKKYVFPTKKYHYIKLSESGLPIYCMQLSRVYLKLYVKNSNAPVNATLYSFRYLLDTPVRRNIQYNNLNNIIMIQSDTYTCKLIRYSRYFRIHKHLIIINGRIGYSAHSLETKIAHPNCFFNPRTIAYDYTTLLCHSVNQAHL